MKNFLKKLHIGTNQSEDSEGSTSSSRSKRLSDVPSPEKNSNSRISGWLNSVTNRHSPSPPSSSNVSRGNRMEHSESVSIGGTDAVLDAVQRDSESSNSRDPGVEEEYQIQLALELSAKEDPEAVQIEAVKQISLGSSAPEDAPAEVVAYRYWNYNALSYDDKILDGFYDLYGVLMESNSSKMPSLIDLQRTEVSNHISWEAILVSKAADSKLLKLEQRALEIAVEERSKLMDFSASSLVHKLAVLVSDHMGGPVVDPESMLLAWRSLIYNLKATLGSMVLPLGSLTIGLARHRALLFKVLADSVGIPCRLVKGKQYTGSDDVAMNYVKIDGREYIVDLMAAPGTLIPSDTSGVHGDYEESILSVSPSSKDVDSHPGSFSSGIVSSLEDHSDYGTADKRSRFAAGTIAGNESPFSSNSEQQVKAEKECYNTFHDLTKALSSKEQGQETSSRAGHARSAFTHARSPSWTEGVSSPAVRRMKVKDASQYMIDAAKENPQLAQKLHNVLLESGVVAPPNLFAEIYPEQSTDSTFVHGGVDRPGSIEQPAVGPDNISRRIQELNLRDCHAKIRQVDSHPTIGSGVVVQVTGELSNNGNGMRRFMQTFVLAPREPKKYYVQNDIFRYQDEVFDDQSDEDDRSSSQDKVSNADSAHAPVPQQPPVVEVQYQALPPRRAPEPQPVAETPVTGPSDVTSTVDSTSTVNQPAKTGSSEGHSYAGIAKLTPGAAAAPVSTPTPNPTPVTQTVTPPSTVKSAPIGRGNPTQRGPNDDYQRPNYRSYQWSNEAPDGGYRPQGSPNNQLSVPNEQQVFVGSLTANMTREDLIECFSKFGNVLDAKITTFPDSKRNYGFVAFDDAATAASVYQMQHVTYKSHQLNVEPKTKRPFINQHNPMGNIRHNSYPSRGGPRGMNRGGGGYRNGPGANQRRGGMGGGGYRHENPEETQPKVPSQS